MTLNLIAACIAFLGTHLLLSHPLRAPLVGRVGERSFQGLYSLVAVITMGWMVLAYRAAPVEAPLWMVGDIGWAVASAAMLAGSILLVGSLSRNPALPDPRAAEHATMQAQGVFAITRHPMMWAFMIWAMVHIAVWPTPANIILSGTILLLALLGSIGQDRKKAAQMGTAWQGWQGRTAYVPFVQQLIGRARWADAMPSIWVWGGGILLWLGATWAHGIGAGIWRWI